MHIIASTNHYASKILHLSLILKLIKAHEREEKSEYNLIIRFSNRENRFRISSKLI